MDPDADLVSRVHSLSDLELAVLLSLVSGEHCVIGTPRAGLDDLVEELCLIASRIFGLPCATVDCHKDTTLDGFAAGVLLPASAAAARPQSSRSPPSYTSSRMRMTSASATSASTTASCPVIANVVVAKNLNRAPDAVQIQALELIRAKGLSVRAVSAFAQTPPRPFLFVAVVAAERGFRADGPKADRPPHMTAHLNDVFAMGHWHDPDDGYPNVEEEEQDDRASRVQPPPLPPHHAEPAAAHHRWRRDTEYAESTDTDADSVIKRRNSAVSAAASHFFHQHQHSFDNRRRSSLARTASSLAELPFLSDADIDRLAARSRAVRVDVDVLRYQMNVVAFLRLHRAVAVVGRNCSGASSVSPAATRYFEKLVHCLAPLHGLDYATPALVALAARKVYLHRIRIVDDSLCERSMQWGSSRSAVDAVLEDVSPEDVIEDVLGVVVPPV